MQTMFGITWSAGVGAQMRRPKGVQSVVGDGTIRLDGELAHFEIISVLEPVQRFLHGAPQTQIHTGSIHTPGVLLVPVQA